MSWKSGILKNLYWVVEMFFKLMEHIDLFQSAILSKCFDKELHCFWTRDFSLEVVLTLQESLPHSCAPLTQWWPLEPVANTQYGRLSWCHLSGKWLFAALQLLNWSCFIGCFCFTGEKCLLPSAWSLSQPIHLCYCAVEEKAAWYFS